MIHERAPTLSHDGQWLPVPQPLDMPLQDLARVTADARAPSPLEPRAVVARLAIFGATLLLTAGFAWQLYHVLAVVRLTPIQGVFLVLSTLAFTWVALGSVSALAGGLIIRAGPTPGLQLPPVAPLHSRTALLFPIYHEAPETVAGNIEAMARGLSRLGAADRMDVFILSDSRSTGAATHERQVFAFLTRRLAGLSRVYYRRRPENAGRKSGNVAEWIRRHGAGYDHFVILDADSIMSAELLVRLARGMEVSPRTALIQTVPRLVGGDTLFQKLQQFAAGTYGPPIAAGLSAWQGTRGNYWGHNAIIRTRAFAAAAGLPELPGQPPFGGTIMSHDFVEAAFMLRAGWKVSMVPLEAGSYEGSPPTIVDHVVRDRRWAQGNLQHMAVVRRARLTPSGRLHLIIGAASYIVSAIWAAGIVVGIVLALQGEHLVPSYFRDSKTLFPIWPIIDPGAAQRLFVATMLVVMLPKLTGLLLELTRKGGPRLARVYGILTETCASILIAPMLMVTQTRALAEIVLGRDAGWAAQRRTQDDITLRAALGLTRWQLLTGLAVSILTLAVSLDLALWMSPIILGLVLSGPLVWVTSKPASPLLARLLATDDVDCPAPILAEARRAAHSYQTRVDDA